MRQKLVVALLCTAFATFAGAADAPSAKPPVRKAFSPPVDGPVSDGQFVFQMLLGEMALQRGDPALAASAYADLAQRTLDPKIIERAIEIATFARQGDLAIDMAKLWVDQAPESPKARQTLAGVLLMNNRIDDLGPQISKLLSQEPESVAANLMGLNRLLARYQDKAAAFKLIQQVVAPYQNMPEAQFALAMGASNAGETPYAQRAIRQALRLKPDWELGALFEAQILSKNSTLEAINALDNFVEANPGAKETRLQLARLLIGEKRYSESRRHFERLLKDYPDAPEVVHPVAMLALQQGDVNTARKLLERLLTLDIPDKGGIHYFLGQMDEDRKQIEPALAHYREVTSGEQYLAARARIANLLAQQGQLAEARTTLRDAAARTPAERVQLLLAEAQLLREAKQTQAAYELIADSLSRFPDNADLLYDGALMAERLGKVAEMETMLRKVIASNPKHAHGLNALGYSFAERNIRLPEAYDLINRALALAPEDPFIMDSLGWVLFRQGKVDDALAVLKKAYGLRQDPEIAAHLGEVLWSQNRKDEATKLWKDNAAKTPGNEALSDTMKRFIP